MRRYTALTLGIACHLLFFGAVVVMASALFGGMDIGPLRGSAAGALVVDVLLLAQFPVLHSLFLGARGRRLMERALPGDLGRQMVTTTFVAFASLQLLALFWLWEPLGGFYWEPLGTLRSAWAAAYGAAWVFLGVAMWNAGLSTQMGYLGWLSVWRGEEPRYSSFPTHGLYKVCRHPVYFAMGLVAISGPVWTLDHVVIAAVFCAYCVIGPLRKEARYRQRFGDAFEAYRRSVPFFPLLRFPRATPSK